MYRCSQGKIKKSYRLLALEISRILEPQPPVEIKTCLKTLKKMYSLHEFIFSVNFEA